ncbi:MAG: DUF4234 domain-containing protein [Clostridia bacterium]|nr:DUF4234 domain-containing protein [Clostridia bacterium]
MSFCTKCGAQVADGTKFCPSCGSPLAANGQGGAVPPQQNYAQQGYNPAYGQPNPAYSQPNPVYGAPTGISFGQRNLAVAIILSIVTCGIYGIYWMIKMVDELNEASGDSNAASGVTVFLLSLVTCGIYTLIWLYMAGGRINTAKAKRGMPTDPNTGIIYLVLAIFGLSIVSYALLQIELNKIAAYHGAPAA